MKKPGRFPAIFACFEARGRTVGKMIRTWFTGTIAANGRLYLVSNDGKITCFGANQ